ncbi:unnamed protein product [Rhizoctonia solani]|uniref:Uncharacterized protein n=1 Tax=Rhizoctonia solani TaxID=456999 RepID=A0A8H2XNC6_9AGAM|nr:unnamed protein product [Rhizoctonia solani]
MHTMAPPHQYIKHTNPTGLLTPPPSPYTMAGSAPRHAPSSRSLGSSQLIPAYSMTSGALSQQSGSNGCSTGSSSCSHPNNYHQPQNCRCKKGMNIYCTACRALCFSHC